MLKYPIAYLATLLVFAAMDATYLTVVGDRVYRPLLNYALADRPAMGPAVVFYLIYMLGVLLLAVAPNAGASLGKTAITGAMLGAFGYATYDLTNQATLKVWATHITVIDICWGTLVTAVGASAGHIAWRWAEKRFG